MFKGSIVALVTPMHQEGHVAMDVLHDLIEWHIAEGTQAIVIAGTTGESAALTSVEYTNVIQKTVQQVAKRIPVIAGTGSISTQKTIELTQAAKDLGADACLILTPYCVRPTQAGLIAHYRAIADSVAIPQILYNAPSRTACDLLPETVVQLATHPHIVGIKECVPNRYAQLVNELGQNFDILTGDDATALELLQLGGHGIISVTANIVPKAVRALCDSALKGDWATASRLAEQLADLNKALFLESNPIPVKWALCKMGRIPPGIRLPLTPFAVQYQPELQQALDKAMRS